MKATSFAVIGSGSWATALVKVLSGNGCRLLWYIREPEIRQSLREEGVNCRYLEGIALATDRISISDDVNTAVAEADVLLFVVPAAFLKVTAESITVPLADKTVFSAIKGIVPGENLTVGEYFNRRFGLPFDRFGVVSGPTHAEEVALERLSYLTVAAKRTEMAELMASQLQCRYIRTILSTDIYGIEYGAVLKNIIALCAGIAHGLGYGDNFLAVLVSNGFDEIRRFIGQTYPSERNPEQSVYLGDLLVTCYSQFSRNRTFGTMIGKGYSVVSAQLEMNMVAEGYYASACMHQLNKHYQISLPIAEAVYNILYEKHSPAQEIRLLSEKFC